MTKKRIANQHHATFEGIRHTDDAGQEFWLARQLAEVLDYSQYRHFLPVVERAKEACLNSCQPVENHIEDVLTMVDICSGAHTKYLAAAAKNADVGTSLEEDRGRRPGIYGFGQLPNVAQGVEVFLSLTKELQKDLSLTICNL